MKKTCPQCGAVIEINGLGRKRLNHTVIFVYDTLKLYRTVTATAKQLNCSRGYIYKVLKENGLSVNEVCRGS